MTLTDSRHVGTENGCFVGQSEVEASPPRCCCAVLLPAASVRDTISLSPYIALNPPVLVDSQLTWLGIAQIGIFPTSLRKSVSLGAITQFPSFVIIGTDFVFTFRANRLTSHHFPCPYSPVKEKLESESDLTDSPIVKAKLTGLGKLQIAHGRDERRFLKADIPAQLTNRTDMKTKTETIVEKYTLPNCYGVTRTILIKVNERGRHCWRISYQDNPAIANREYSYSDNWFDTAKAAKRSARRFMKSLAQ